MEKEQRLLSRVMMVGSGAVLSKATVILLLPLYTAVLTPAEFGRAEIVVNTALLLIPFATFGMPDAAFRFIAGGKNQRQVLQAAMRIGIAGLLGLMAILPLLALFHTLRPFLSYLFFYVIASALHSFWAHVLRARGEHALYAVQQLFCTFLTVALSFLFLPVWMFGVRGYLLAILLADAITAILIAVYFVLCGGFVGGKEGVGTKEMLRYSVPLMPTSALWWSIAYLDRFVLLSYHGTAAVGLLAAAGRIPSLLTFVVGVFFEAWQYSALRVSDDERAKLFERIYGMLCAGLVALALLLMLIARPLVGFVFATDFAGSVQFVPFLVLGAFFLALSSFLGSVYMVKMRSRMSLVTALLGAVVNAALCFWLVPQKGVFGAVTAGIVAYLIAFVCRSIQVRRMLPFAQHGLKLAICSVLLFAVAFFLGRNARIWALLVAALALLPFWRESMTAFFVLWRYLQHFFKKKQKQS